MITEDYVSFETAKLLKEKGFDCPCKVWYAEYTSQFSGEKYNSLEFDDYNIFNGDYKFLFYVPTLQMAMKWLMEKKGIAIIPVLSSILDNEKFLWDIKIVVAKTGERYSQGWIYEKQEEAFDTAIKYCLESLI